MAALALGLAWVVAPRAASAQCVDEALREQLIGQRAYRGVVPRLFQKSLRHELSALGGWYSGDLSDGAPVYGGAYTFHFTEDLGLEASYLRTKQSFELLEAVTAAAHGLQKLKVIRYSRGRITVLDRKKLEQLCCECYAVVKRETDRLLPQPAD